DGARRVAPPRPHCDHRSPLSDRLVELSRRARGQQHPRTAVNRLRPSPPAFTVAFCSAYAIAFALNWPLFLYYPLHGEFAWGWSALDGAGPAIVWYGFMADATVVGLAAGFCLPNAAVGGRLRNYLWMFPSAAMVTCVLLLRHLFF